MISQALRSSSTATETLIFSDHFAPGESQTYIVTSLVSASIQAAVNPQGPSTFGRFVPERLDDFAWENDRVAFRMYGPALASQNGGSGLDCWLKRVSYSIINKWYELHLKGLSYHVDRGEGYDPYHVGQSRGCGSLSYEIGGSQVSSSVFKSYEILDNGPLRTRFKLNYETQVSSHQIAESKLISIDLGSPVSKFEVSVTDHGRPATFPLVLGINSHENKGYGSLDPTGGVMTVWETIDDSQLGTGVFTDPASIDRMYEIKSSQLDEAHTFAVLKPELLGKASYFAGYAWVKAGSVQNLAHWHRLLEQWQRQWLHPMKIDVRLN
jgi:hypothetical protein